MEAFVFGATVVTVWGKKPTKKYLQINYMEFSKHLENTNRVQNFRKL